MKYCSKKHGNPDDAEFCHECGEKLQEKKRKGVRMCPRCGTASLDYGYCTHCGYIFSSGGTMPGYKMPFIEIKHCLKCGMVNSKDAEFCLECGCKLGKPISIPSELEQRLKYLKQDHKKKCRECGYANIIYAKFCVSCGHEFDEQSQPEYKTVTVPLEKLKKCKVCQHCKAVNSNDAEFCAECGASLTQQSKPKLQPTSKPQPKLNNGEKVCQKCKAVNPKDAEFCAECGASLTQQSKPKPQPTPKPQPKLNNGEKVCQKCKTVNPNDAEFCAGCGASLTLQPKPKPQSTHRPQPTPMPQPKSEPQSSYSSNSSNNLSWGCLLVPLLFGVIAILICVYGGFWKDFWLYVGIGSLLVGIEELIKKLKRLF